MSDYNTKNKVVPVLEGDFSTLVDPPRYCLQTAPLWKYSRSFAEAVCDHLINGKTLTAICKQQGMPSYATVCYWRANNIDFDNAIKKAKQMRAEMFRDQIQESLDAALYKDDIAEAKLAFDKLKYLASVDDPSTFGKQNLGNGGDTNVQVIIETGIRRNE